MYALCLIVALLITGFQQSEGSREAMRLRAEADARKYEEQAIRLNDAAGNIHSEADARAIVDSVAQMFAKELPPAWMTAELRQRIAHLEYESATNAGSLIPEQRLADVWNKYVHEIGASDEALVTVAEIHNLRDAYYASGQWSWEQGFNRSIWTMPKIYALGSDGKVAPGCRALESLRVLHDLDSLFENLRTTRLRMQKGIVASDEIKKQAQRKAAFQTRLVAGTRVEINPVREAETRFIKERGELAMSALVLQLFQQLFPE